MIQKCNPTRFRVATWQNCSVGVFRTSVGHVFLEDCVISYRFCYKKDFFRNTLWEVLDEPAPIETILQFIRRYGMIPQTLLSRIYFYEAKKKRRAYRSIERVMTRRITQILWQQRNYKPRMTNPGTLTVTALWEQFTRNFSQAG